MTAILKVKDGNGNVIPIQAIKGEKGEKGDRGLPGSGGVPDGGTTGQVLTKNSNADGDAGWKDTEHDLFNANGKTYEEVIYAYESGKVCYLTYAGTKLLNNGYSGNRNPFKFSGENSNGEILTATLSYDNTLTFGDRGDYQITTASQTLSKEKQSQALANIGGLSKNQGTANSGKFLGIGADGIVVPTDVGGGSGWTELYQGTVEASEPVSSLTVNLTKSCEGMTEAIMSFASTKGEGELTGNTSMHCKFGLFGVTYGRLGNYSAACDDKYYLLAPNKYQSMFYKNSKMTNSIYYNTAQCLIGWVEPTTLNNPNYNQMVIDFWGSPGYQGTITLRIVGR